MSHFYIFVFLLLENNCLLFYSFLIRVRFVVLLEIDILVNRDQHQNNVVPICYTYSGTSVKIQPAPTFEVYKYQIYGL